MTLPLPDIYEESKVKDVYVERSALVADAAKVYQRKNAIKPAGQDKFRIAAFGIDCQVGFCSPAASLFVPGAVEDMQRATRWIYGNMDKITELAFSFDTHRVFQIFHPAWWTDAAGNHPAPFTTIRFDEVRSGKWTPVTHPKECLEYARRLEATGKYVLTIWPYHTLLGGLSHALVPALMEASIFHSIARLCQSHFETKGTHAMTENYSVLSPEVRELGGQPVGAFNAPFFKMLMEFDRIYVFGEAKSHCVLSTINDLKQEIESTDPRLMDKVWILEDAMSPVPPPPISPLPPELNFPMIAEKAIDEFRRAGMHIVKTTDPVNF